MPAVIIEITKEDIAAGDTDNCTTCPVALAMRRATGELWSVDYLEVNRRRDGAAVVLPELVTDWIERFDIHEEVLPLQFELEIPA
jgi:hypothetical protein